MHGCSDLVTLLTDHYASLALQRLKAKQATDADTDLDTVLTESQYLVPLSDGVFALANPKATEATAQVLATHRAWHVSATGALSRVHEFVQWVNSARDWGSDAVARHSAVVRTDEGRATVDCRNLLLTVVEDPLAVQRAAQRVLAPNYWRAQPVERLGGMRSFCVPVLQHVQGQVPPQIHCALFSTRESAQEFAQGFSAPQPGNYPTPQANMSPATTSANEAQCV